MWNLYESRRHLSLVLLLTVYFNLCCRVYSEAEISDFIRKCCIGGLRHARFRHTCDKFDREVVSIPPLWIGLCHSTFGVCCSREVEKQNCEAGRFAALAGSRCDEVQNSTAYADCCRACQVGLAVKAGAKNCSDPLFSYFAGIESYRKCCQDSDRNGINHEGNGLFSEKTLNIQLNGSKSTGNGSSDEDTDGTIVLHDDDDICSKIPNLCAQICENTYSAYQCKCYPGFKLDENNVTCTVINFNENTTENKQLKDDGEENISEDVDDDEIVESFVPYNKQANLTRNVPNMCPSGYEFNTTREKCIDVDECQRRLHDCQEKEFCHNIDGHYHCLGVEDKICESGYRYSMDTNKCDDYNECDNMPCEAGYQCFNYPGGYECQKNNKKKMKKTNVNNKCESGFELQNELCVDIDECLDQSGHVCDVNQVCNNDIGGYHCDCKIGFNLDGTTNACVDINECSINNHNCLPTQRCDNTVGSYVCTRLQSCGTGYTLNAETGSCDDDDECALSTHNCPTDYECFNTKGSFRCYRRTPSTTPTTTTVTPKAFEIPKLLNSRSPEANETNSRTEYTPNYKSSSGDDWADTNSLPCTLGFTRNRLGACVDVNECKTMPCGSHQRCINTNGSYRCENLLQCTAGFKSTPEGSSCTDVDECETGEHNCAENQICHNRIGGYICVCPPGHQLTRLSNGDNRCIDINECIHEHGSPPVCPSNAQCLNTIGSFYCECKSGFQKRRQDVNTRQYAQCYDVDECQEIPGLCQQKCVNFWGGYRCTCNTGYELSADNRTCNDIDECEIHTNYKLCMGYCNNVPGSYECSCPRGYTLGADKNTCRDIDECETSEVCTGRYDICTNIRGSFKCTTINCPSGYVNDPEQKNRCRQVSNYCDGEDCYNKPSAYTYNFITLVSKLMMPPEGRTIFTLRGPLWYDDIDFDLKILRIQAAPNIEKASESHFNTFKGHNQVNLILKRPLDGPQDVELELSMTVFTNGMPRGKSVGKIFIYVSQYTF